MAIRNLRVRRTANTAIASSVMLEIIGSGDNPLLPSDCVGNALPTIAVQFGASDTEKVVALPLKAGVDPTKQCTARLVSPQPSATLPGSASETIGYTVAETGDPATAPLSPAVADSFDGDGSLASRPNWTVPAADTGRWSTSGGKLAFAGGASSVVKLGPVIAGQVARFEYDMTAAAASDRQSIRLWSKDASNYLNMVMMIGHGPDVLYELQFRAVVDGAVQSSVAKFRPSYPAAYTAKGTIEVALVNNEVRVRWNGHWVTKREDNYNYPFDRAKLTTDLGMPLANQAGVLGIEANGTAYARSDGVSISTADIVIEKQNDFVGQIAANSPDCAATIGGTYTGPDNAVFQYRLIPIDLSAAGAWSVVTPTLAAGGKFSIEAIVPHNTDHYVEVAWIGSDGLYRSTVSLAIQSGDNAWYVGQSNSNGRKTYFDIDYDIMHANVAYDSDDGQQAAPGRVASKFVPIRSSASAALAKGLAAKTGVRTCVLVSGINGASIEAFYPPSSLYNEVILRDRAKLKGIIKVVFLDQGEGSADGSAPTPNYGSALLNKFRPAIVEACGNPDVKIGINLIGNFPSGAPNGSITGVSAAQNDTFRSYIRDEQLWAIGASNGQFFECSSKLGLPHGNDPYHYIAAGYAEACARDALSAAKALGFSSTDGRGPIPTSMTRSGRVLTFTLDLNGSTSITDLIFKQTFDGTRVPPSVANSLYGYQVSLKSGGNFTSLLPIESIAPSSDRKKLVITLANDPGAEVKVRSFTGATYDDTNLFWGSNGIPINPITIPLAA